jgi:hypothetical protein
METKMDTCMDTNQENKDANQEKKWPTWNPR